MSAEWELLRGLFEGALERPTHERAAFLDEHTKDDPALRREIESLLAAHESAGAVPERAGARSADRSHPIALPADRRLGCGSDTSRGGHVAWRLHDCRTCSAPAAWARSTAPAIRGSIAQVAIKVLSSERDTAPGAPRAVRTRSARDLPAVASPDLHGARRRRRRHLRVRRAVSRHGAAGRRDAGGADRARAALDRAVARLRHRHRRRADRGARPGHRAPRSEAGQRHGDQHRREAAGFRSGAAARAGAGRACRPPPSPASAD